MSWSRFIQDRVHERGSAIYLVDARSGRKISYREFLALAWAASGAIAKSGVKKGERVALIFPNGVEFVLTYFACLCAGVIAVPINPNVSEKDIEVLLSLSRPSLVIVGKGEGGIFEKQNVISCLSTYRIYNIDGELLNDSCEKRNELNPCEFEDDQLWTIHFTSGTTGVPKGVCHTVSSLLSSARAFSDKLKFTAEDRMYHIFPMFYMAGFLNTLLCPFVSGGSVVLGLPCNAGSFLNFWEIPAKFNVSILWMVPTMLASLLRMDRGDKGKQWARSHIRMVCVGTAPLPRKVKTEFQEAYGVDVLESYGLSETLFVCSNSQQSPRSEGSVGVLLEGVDVRICDESGNSASEGDILIRGNGMMLGYWDKEKKGPVRTLLDGWFVSGDVGKMESSGELFITGRKKDIIIRGGENISPKKIEEVLLAHPSVDEAVVIGFPHDFYGEEVIAICVLKSRDFLKTGATAELIKHCRSLLNAKEVPTHFYFLDEIPRNSTGKTSRKDVLEKLMHEKK